MIPAHIRRRLVKPLIAAGILAVVGLMAAFAAEAARPRPYTFKGTVQLREPGGGGLARAVEVEGVVEVGVE